MMQEFLDPEACVDALIAHVGRDLRVGTPLGAGKPNHLLNALYRRAKKDPSIQLTIFTALTLQRPVGKSLLESRFLGPFVDRIFGNYVDPEFEIDRVAGALPENVRVIEFYFAPAKYIGNTRAQRDYISSNYTHAARDIIDRGINVLAQQVASGTIDGEEVFSLSCNPDLSADVMREMRRQEAQGRQVAFVVQTNDNLPFMYGDDAVYRPDDFHFLVRNPELNYTLFGPPKESITDVDYLIGLYVSSLVRDGGELQVGIGALGDSVVYGLLLRHEQNDVYREVLDALQIAEKFPEPYERLGGNGPFEEGLFAASEMLVDGFLDLFERGVIKRQVFDDVHIQRLLNLDVIDETVTPKTLESLLGSGAIGNVLTESEVDYLCRFGVFRSDVRFAAGRLIRPGAPEMTCDLTDLENRALVVEHCLGERLRHGAVMHGGFFLGSPGFYRALREMPEERRQLIRMRSVTRINQLYGHEEIDRLHRRNARFVNTCMMATLSGAAVSDGLDNGTVISGVGGQFNFVDMAQALPDGHSILNLRATRRSKGRVTSNVVWNYGHTTVPRHMRDVYITEYGIAYVRGKTDEEIIQALLQVTDSRFQGPLLARAKAAGKIDPDWEIPAAHRHNTPEAVAEALAPFKGRGLFPAFPFGTELTEQELALGKALKGLAARTETRPGTIGAVLRGLIRGGATPEIEPLLARMGLDEPKTAAEHLYRRLLVAELKS